jgi:hypothetical protein
LHLLPAPFFQRLIAFQTDSERAKLAIEVEGINYLTHLVFRLIAGNQDDFESSAGYYPPFHNLGVSGQYHPAFIQSSPNHVGVIAAIEKQGIITHHPQPLSQFADIVVNDELWITYWLRSHL